MLDTQVLFLTALLGIFGLLVFYISNVFKSNKTAEEGKENEEDEDQGVDGGKKGGVRNGGGGKTGKAEKVQQKRGKGGGGGGGGSAVEKFSHSWLLTTLKGHSGRIFDMDFSENGKYLASCSEDRSVLLWTVKDFLQKEHRSHRGNVSYDMATRIKWSPDSKAYVIHKASANCIEVYKMSKKEDGGGGGSFGAIQPVLAFPARHVTDVIGLGFASTGRFIMSCSDKTELLIWDIRGEVLATIDTYHMSTYCAKVSPCGRFVATSGFTPDVKVWEVKFSRAGEFEKVQRAFELTGHASGVFCFDFNSDSSRMVTLSKDATWRLYDTKVEFDRGQDPSCLQKSAPLDFSPDKDSLVALSPDATVVVVGHRSTITWYSTSNAQACGRIEGAHGQSGSLSCLLFDKEGRWLLSSSSGDRHVQVFHNVPNWKCRLLELEEKMRKATSEGMKERLSQQVVELKSKLQKFE